MAIEFSYRARARDGKPVQGARTAQDQAAVVKWLRDQGLTPVTITQTPSSAARGMKKEGSLLDRLNEISTVSIRDKALFFRQLATMMASGMTIAATLDILKDQTSNKRFASAIAQVKKLLDSGYSMAAAMKTRNEFSTLMIAMVQAGEEGGQLDSALDRTATFLEKQEALRRKIKSAITYPSVVMTFAIGVLYILVTVIVPKFQIVFSQMNAELPFITQLMFNLSDFLRNQWYIPVAVVFGLVFGLIAMNKMKETKNALDYAKLRIPAFGNILYMAIMARSMRTLGSLVQAGVPILTALDMAGEVADNAPITNAFTTLRDAARKGASLGETAKGIKIFPPMAAHMLVVGEQTGRLEEMTNKVADWFDAELDAKVSQLTSILEPVLIVFVGGVVALVALAVFSPIVGAIQAML